MLEPYDPRHRQDFINMVIYGDPGVGKTILAYTAQDNPGLGDVVLANIEGGLISIKHRSDMGRGAVDLGKDENGNPTYREVEDLEELYWKVLRKSEGYEKVKTVIIDSGSELQVANLQAIIKNADPRKKRDIDDLWQEDYGKSTARLRRVFRMFRDAPFNVIITALSKTETQDMGKGESPRPVRIAPQFTAKLCDSVCGYMDFVWYLYIDKEKGTRKILTQTRGIVFAKTRGVYFAEKLGQVVDDPNLATIYDLFKNTEIKE